MTGFREKLRIIAELINNNETRVRVEVWGYRLALIALDGTIFSRWESTSNYTF
ncbi:MAG: hypothetical protein HRO68_06100 [Nitrosopumilus sp.]|nr:hypothetical protein [Nitrosopumilus sp.]